MFNLATILESSAIEYPDKDAIVCGATRLTYAQLNAEVNRVATGLIANGLKAGDKIALACPNLPFFPIVYYAVLKVGAVLVPLNILLSADEIAYHLSDSDAVGLIGFDGSDELPLGARCLAAAEQVPSCQHCWIIPAGGSGNDAWEALLDAGTTDFASVSTEPDATAVILYTSGTTGQPKGAELSHINLMLNFSQCSRHFNAGHDDVLLVVLPLFHTFGQNVQMNMGIYMGNKLVLMPKFAPDAVVDALLTEAVTVFSGVPTMYWSLLNEAPIDAAQVSQLKRKLRLCVSGGASLPVEILRGFEEKFSVPILEGYGLSETSPVATFNRIDRERKPGTVGPAIWGVQVQVVDEQGNEVERGERGEVVVRGPNVMKGYYQRPAATAEAIRGGWFHTGDVGIMDEDGYLSIVDRLKEMIIRGGYNVYPRELEEVMLSHPDISLVAVVGVPDERFGEEIKAFIIPRSEANLSEQGVVAWCKEKMGAHKYPRLVEIRDALPMTATGKILKRELKPE